MIKKILLFILCIFVFIILISSVYVQRQDRQSIVIRLDKINRIVETSGLKFKYPFIESTVIYTKRIIPYDTPEFSIITRDKKTIIFDTVAFYQIIDPAKFYLKFRTINGVQQWIDDTSYAAVRNQAGRYTFEELLTDKRDDSLDNAIKYINKDGNDFGVKIINIKLKRVDVPQSNELAIYKSMIAERNQQATQINAEGEAVYKEITSKANRIYVTKTSEARKTAEKIKGDADKQAQEMINQTMASAPNLYTYMKTLELMKKVIKPDTPFIVKQDGVFKNIKN